MIRVFVGETAIIRVFTTLVIAIASACSAASQGFDWQYSARLPVNNPIRFYGIELASGYTSHVASLDYLEKGTGIKCCTYERGNGIPYGVLVAGDYWLEPDVSIQGGLGLLVRSVSLTSDPQSYPSVGLDSIVTFVSSEYVFQGSLTYLTAQAALRYRILGTHLNVGGGVKLLLKLAESQTQIDRVIGPDNYYFDGNPPTKEKDLEATLLNDASGIVIEPFVSLGYDLSIRRGMYLTPTVTVGGPVTSLSKTQPWRSLDLGFSIRLMNAF